MTAHHVHRPVTSAPPSATCNRSNQLALLRAGVIAVVLLAVLVFMALY